jgi:hypothetical protein
MSDFALTPSERATKDAEIKQLSESLTQAREEIAYWQDLIEMRGQQKVIDDLIIRHRITPAEAAITATLIRRYPVEQPLTPDDLEYILPGQDHAEERDLQGMFSVYLCRLRKRFGTHCFQRIRSVGVMLTEAGNKELAM